MNEKDLPISVGIFGDVLSRDDHKYCVVCTGVNKRTVAKYLTKKDAEYIVSLIRKDIARIIKHPRFCQCDYCIFTGQYVPEDK